jgi:hypothetical protein
MAEILDGYATELEANKQSRLDQLRQARLAAFIDAQIDLEAQKDKEVWDAFAAAALASVVRQLPSNCCVKDVVGEQCAYAAAIADHMLDERKKRYGSVES